MPVSESDPSIAIETPQLRRPDGAVQAYAAYPGSVRANTPGVVLLMSEHGVDDHLRDVVRRFAKAGFTCIAPDLVSRAGEQAQPLERKRCGGDVRAAALHLLAKAPQCKLGVAGFGIGGTLALAQALDNADVFDAVALFYAPLKGIDPSELHVPICASYGERDATVPPEEVRIWRSVLRVPSDVRLYAGAGNAFFDDTRMQYVASAAADAWKRTLAFFAEKLGLQT
jgi:carboxymethylenebutenolidase